MTLAGALLMACDLLEERAADLDPAELEFVREARELAEGRRSAPDAGLDGDPAEAFTVPGGVLIHCPGCSTESCPCVAR